MLVFGTPIHRREVVRRSALALTVLAATLVIGSSKFSQIVVNGTPSIDAYIFIKSSDAPQKNDYVLAQASHPYMPSEYRFLAKRMLCVAGETLSFRDGAFYCEGLRIAVTKAATRTGETLEPFAWETAPIPSGFAFIGSGHPDGFDSRYIGLIAIDDLVRLEALL